ncbi:hypothetical protein P167DRAFT_539629 [Morchella conica CCBAS932]|uniref:Uncharacterized protein n=1 Tax=Morchella conica CCBAS932 TaxID=1392247 RepID=A0A3N4KBZ7_9PEZI|nr:hypothetical protein P167DRAFT_539629 [Morchella conica CCBAS932]
MWMKGSDECFLYRLRMKKRWRRRGATNRDVRTGREEQAPGCELTVVAPLEVWSGKIALSFLEHRCAQGVFNKYPLIKGSPALSSCFSGETSGVPVIERI